jgi:hypothetical protein
MEYGMLRYALERILQIVQGFVLPFIAFETTIVVPPDPKFVPTERLLRTEQAMCFHKAGLCTILQ